MIIDELFEAPQQCPECGGISFSDLILAEKKDACYHKVKASAKVWPSAYASGRLVQCRKKGAANYGNKSEGVAEGFGGGAAGFLFGIPLAAMTTIVGFLFGTSEGGNVFLGTMALSTALGSWLQNKSAEADNKINSYRSKKIFSVFVNGEKISTNLMDYANAGKMIANLAKKEHDPNTYFTIYDNEAEEISWRFQIKDDKREDDEVEESIDQGVAEGLGDQGNFAGDTPVNIGSDTAKRLGVGDIVSYLGQKSKIVAQSKDRKYSRITIASDFGGTTKDVLTSDLKRLGQNMAEGVMYGAENLHVGDNVIISGDVELNGATGVIDSFGQDKRFVVVNLFNHGPHSFHSSDVSANDYDNDEHDDLDETRRGQIPMTLNPGETDNLEPENLAGFRALPAYKQGQAAQQKAGKQLIQKSPYTFQSDQDWSYRQGAFDTQQAAMFANFGKSKPLTIEGGEQQKGADYRDPKEVDYDDEYDAMVARVKKLAGLGPLKTVYDPTKRVYRNMPTAVQPKK
jgi:hypothetical protein